MALREEELYDAYLERCLAGDPEPPETFLASWPEANAELRERLAGLYRMHGRARPAPERIGGFRLLRRLGAGAMGEVYLAEQEKLGRQVALKLIRPELVGSKTAAARFDREARAVARLRHPNIVRLFEFGEDRGVLYLALELVDGDGLDRLIGRGPVPWRTAVRWVRDIARALQHAHDAGIVHRDVKPGNIRLTPEGRPLLLDFGIARDHEAEARLTQTYAGSPLYSAPEVMPGMIFLKAGTLDDTSWLRPELNMWCDTAQPWVSIDQELPVFPGNPPLG